MKTQQVSRKKEARAQAQASIPAFQSSSAPGPCHSISPPLHHSSIPTLRNEFGFWELTFNGQCAVLRCEPGAAYVAWLLENRPAQPISSLELAAKISGATCPCFGSEQVFHPDKAAATLFWLRKQHELEMLVDNEDTLDPVKEEAWRELEAIYAYQKTNPSRASHDAQAAARTVRAALEDFCRHLARARNLRGEPHPLACAFAKYIHEHVLEPSRERGQDGFWLVL
jgi:hypothetical protein